MADTTMKAIIDDLKTALEAAITGGTLSATKIFKGFNSAPEQVADSEFPYVMLDDGGERTELNDSMTAQDRFFSIMFEVGCYSMVDISTAMDQVMDVYAEVKVVIEAQANRLADGFIWGITVTPFGWEADGSFYRGRQFIVEYRQLEDTRYIY